MLIGTIEDWKNAYTQGAMPAELLEQQRLACSAQDTAWISIASTEQLQTQLAQLAALELAVGREQLPLYGVPFAVKDNIDVEGFRTTAACEEFAYVAQEDAFAIQRLRNAGAIVLGKTNLDQFATGLVGTRSPYGIVPNTFDASLISGGSSSGSASVVARGLVPFALSTDTAGSGRVPAGFNQIVGLKPTPGAVSGTGLVPACRTLDCIGVLACTVADSASVLSVMEGHDAADGYSRARPMAPAHKPLAQLRVATPAHRKLSGSYETAFAEFSSRLKEQTAQLEEIPFGTLFEVAELLYYGPWVAERVVGARRIYEDQPDRMLPVVRSVLDVAQRFSAADTFAAQYRLQELKQEADRLWQQWDVLCVPTAPRHPRIDEVMADPIAVNSEMGIYTNFVNLLGWSAIAIPASRLPDGLPFGITLIAPGWREPDLVRWAAELEQQAGLPAGVTGLKAGASAAPCAWTVGAQGDMIQVAVVGAHLRGMPLNHELLSCGARFVEATQTSADYRLYALQGTVPPKPGLSRGEGGAAIAVEVWEMPLAHFGRFVAGVPAPLGIGTVTLASGKACKGFICEGHALAQATDITAFGGWRAYCSSLR
ncbi:allophanate hydrolase [Comamonas endophytica]|uniref:Allophanate hydrolase n=1 Tax=Comamonas endophytica TaxID=2949090 RepID=A0ABY6G580_9BURK|nr:MULTISPECIES: allophanate hydrolase [unclassified Acidovorax]MCD2512403.1 allophanate hydrolase [Acidovorax sp. D4N7]UYG50150.1 allophanate hydrolase [Acidovorax sp. 5MLIR]